MQDPRTSGLRLLVSRKNIADALACLLFDLVVMMTALYYAICNTRARAVRDDFSRSGLMKALANVKHEFRKTDEGNQKTQSCCCRILVPLLCGVSPPYPPLKSRPRAVGAHKAPPAFSWALSRRDAANQGPDRPFTSARARRQAVDAACCTAPLAPSTVPPA